MSVDDRFEAFRLAVQGRIWPDEDEDTAILPVLLKANIDPDNRTIFMVVRVGTTKYMIEFGLPVPENFQSRQEVFGLENGEVGTDDDGPSVEQVTEAEVTEALEGTRSWSDAIQDAEAGPLKSYWTTMRTRIANIFPTIEQYYVSLEHYLRHAFNQEPSRTPPTLISIYTSKANKRSIAIIIAEGEATYRLDYHLPIPAKYPARLFPGKQHSMILGPEGPTRVSTVLPFAEEGFHLWEQEILRVGDAVQTQPAANAPADVKARHRLSKALLQFWQESQHNIFVVLRRAGILPKNRHAIRASGSEPAVSNLRHMRHTRHTRGRRGTVSASPIKKRRITRRLTNLDRGRGWDRPRIPRDSLDPRTASSEIGTVRRQVRSSDRRQPSLQQQQQQQQQQQSTQPSTPKGPIL
jgi:hypothetical protein